MKKWSAGIHNRDRLSCILYKLIDILSSEHIEHTVADRPGLVALHH
jgi:hypothetical protein